MRGHDVAPFHVPGACVTPMRAGRVPFFPLFPHDTCIGNDPASRPLHWRHIGRLPPIQPEHLSGVRRSRKTRQ